MGVMEGRDAKHIGQRYKDMYKPALIANWQVWPMAQVCGHPKRPVLNPHAPCLQLINFRFMPLPYRVPFQSTCGVFWTLYLSLLNAKYVQVVSSPSGD